MNFKDCIKFTNEHPVCYLATSVDGQPRFDNLQDSPWQSTFLDYGYKPEAEGDN
jgi:hypothetical protein